MADATFTLMAEFACQSPHELERLQSIFRYFQDMETEYETGIPVLPGWASIGNVAAQYGLDGAESPLGE